MESTSLEHITVTDIVKRSGLTHHTFYRYFCDKYDLVNWYFDVLAKQCFDAMGVTLTHGKTTKRRSPVWMRLRTLSNGTSLRVHGK